MKLTLDDKHRLSSWKEGQRFPGGDSAYGPILPRVAMSVVSRLSSKPKTARGKLRAVIAASQLVLNFLEQGESLDS